jgi:hypothetical protein
MRAAIQPIPPKLAYDPQDKASDTQHTPQAAIGDVSSKCRQNSRDKSAIFHQMAKEQFRF